MPRQGTYHGRATYALPDDSPERLKRFKQAVQASGSSKRFKQAVQASGSSKRFKEEAELSWSEIARRVGTHPPQP